MEVLFAYLLSKLPLVIQVAVDLTAAVNAAKSAKTIYAAAKDANPEIAEIINKSAAAFPAAPGVGFAEHLEQIAKALLGIGAWPAAVQDWINANAALVRSAAWPVSVIRRDLWPRGTPFPMD